MESKKPAGRPYKVSYYEIVTFYAAMIKENPNLPKTFFARHFGVGISTVRNALKDGIANGYLPANTFDEFNGRSKRG